MEVHSEAMRGRLVPAFFYFAVIAAFAILLGLWIRIQSIDSYSSSLNYLFNAGIAGLYLIGAIIGGVLIANETNSLKRLFFFAMTLSAFFSSIAMSIWSYFNLLLHIERPYPSLADLFFVLFTIFLGVGFWHYFDLLRINLKRHNLIESIIIVFCVCILMFFLLQPDYNRSMSVLEIVFNYLYPLGDAITLGVALVVLRNTGIQYSGVVLLFLSVCFLIAGDVLFSVRSSQGIYWNGDVSDLMYLFSAMLQILGTIYAFFDKEKIYQLHKST